MDKETRLQNIEELLDECEKDLEVLHEIQEQLVSVEANRKLLDDYYRTQYMEDYDEAEKLSRSYRILDQDSIWNVLQSQYQEKIKLIKIITKSI